MIKQIPNIFTLSNLFFGCCAIVFILQSGESLIDLNHNGDIVTYLPEKIWIGTLFIFIAAVMDFFDGFVARLLKASSPLGMQLDSLADVVSFGVAPAMILFQLLRISLTHQFEGLNLNWFVLSPAFLVACFAAYRLGKFNLDARQSKHFIGMPTPAMAMFVAVLPMIAWQNTGGLNTILLNPFFLYGIIALLCFLMVSDIPFYSLKITRLSKKHAPKFILLTISVCVLFIFKYLGFAILWSFYVIFCIAMSYKKTEKTF